MRNWNIIWTTLLVVAWFVGEFFIFKFFIWMSDITIEIKEKCFYTLCNTSTIITINDWDSVLAGSLISLLISICITISLLALRSWLVKDNSFIIED